MPTDVLLKTVFELSKNRDGTGQPSQTELDDALVQASWAGDITLVNWLLSRGARVEYWQDEASVEHMEQLTYRSSAILAACQQGHLDLVLRLSSCGSRQLVGDRRHYWSILMETLQNHSKIVGKGDDEINEEIIRADEVDPFRQPFYFLESPKLLHHLVEHGADLDMKGSSGKTPLMRAASLPRLSEALIILLEAGADLNVTSKQHHSALACAARSKNISAMKMLLKHGANLAPNVHSEVIPKWPVCPALILCICQGDVDGVRVLIESGAQPCSMPSRVLPKLHVKLSNGLSSVANNSMNNVILSYLKMAFYVLQPDIIQYFLQISFFHSQDLISLAHDWKLLYRLQEMTASKQRTDGIDFQPENANNRNANGGVEDDDNRTRLISAMGDYVSAVKTLKLLEEVILSKPLSLFSLALIRAREVFKIDGWTRDLDKLNPKIKAALRLPPPLLRALLYQT